MKIQAINVNFKGLFTNKTKENGGNWKMEYSPYSWEMKNEKEFGMAPQTELDVFSKTLPDNEKRYIVENIPQGRIRSGSTIGRESCEDILGTEFYYRDNVRNSLRKHITEVPAMNLEDSLKVKSRKLEQFLREKIQKQIEIEKSFHHEKQLISDYDDEFEKYSSDYNEGFLIRDRSKDENKSGMKYTHNKLVNVSKTIIEDFKKYINLRNCIDSVIKEKSTIALELERLGNARENNNLIDISKRDIYDPNKALWEALQNIKENASKLIALPHKTIAMKELIAKIGKVSESEFAELGIKIIDQMIKTKV